jgi:hypothetical protein
MREARRRGGPKQKSQSGGRARRSSHVGFGKGTLVALRGASGSRDPDQHRSTAQHRITLQTPRQPDSSQAPGLYCIATLVLRKRPRSPAAALYSETG